MKSKVSYNIVIVSFDRKEMFVGKITFMPKSRVYVVGKFTCNGSETSLIEDVNDFFANFSRLGKICISPIR